jgi:hypothetical protein
MYVFFTFGYSNTLTEKLANIKCRLSNQKDDAPLADSEQSLMLSIAVTTIEIAECNLVSKSLMASAVIRLNFIKNFDMLLTDSRLSDPQQRHSFVGARFHS